MKYLLIIALVGMVGCSQKKEPHLPTFHIFSFDSCEYVIALIDNAPMMAHKGNCKFCAQRSKPTSLFDGAWGTSSSGYEEISIPLSEFGSNKYPPCPHIVRDTIQKDIADQYVGKTPIQHKWVNGFDCGGRVR